MTQPAEPVDKSGKRKLRAVSSDDVPPLFDDHEPCWQDGLKKYKGRVTKSVANVELILSEHEDWKGKLVHDSFASRTQSVAGEDGKPLPCTEAGPWRDVDTTRTQVWLAQQYGIEVGHDTIDRVVESIAHRNCKHPVVDYLDGLNWDATKRLPSMLHRIFGTPDTPYYSAVAVMWMISAVARVRKPGCQADYVLVLVSPEQGLRKSTAIRILGKNWVADTAIPIGDKDALVNLQGVWIYEIAELSSVRGARDIEAVKAFVTSRCDHFRAPFERRTRDWPRHCVFAGSVNEQECLSDPSGNRRFWPVDCGPIDIAALEAEVDQLWAEADTRYQSGEPWYPTNQELNEDLRAAQEEHTAQDDWLEPVRKWLAGEYAQALLVNGITTGDVLSGPLSVDTAKITKAQTMRMATVLRQCGLVSRKVRIVHTIVRKFYVQ